MIVVIPLAVLLVVLTWIALRRRRAGVLAGLSAGKPVFHLEPPRRSLSSRRKETL